MESPVPSKFGPCDMGRTPLFRLVSRIVCFTVLLQASGVAALPPPPEAVPSPPSPPELAGRGTVAVSVAAAATPGDFALAPGFHLVSIPHQPADPAPDAVLAEVAGRVARVYAYDACDPAAGWKIWDPADPAASTLGAITPTTGFWIDVTEPLTLPAAGAVPERTTFRLCRGWNLIGVPLEHPRLVRGALAPIEGKYLRVYDFEPDDPEDPWAVFDPAAPDWASDLRILRPGRGYWVLVTEDVDLELASSGPPPAVELTAPGDTQRLTTFTDVAGTVASDLLDSWELAFRPRGGEGAWRRFASGQTPVAGALLGVFDPTLLMNDFYDLRLTAVDVLGRSASVTRTVEVAGEQKIGPVVLSFLDLVIPLAGVGLEVIRTYDSRERLQEGDFGFGWRLEVRYTRDLLGRVTGVETVRLADPFPVAVARLENRASVPPSAGLEADLDNNTATDVDAILHPTLAIATADVRITEGDADLTDAVFTVTLSNVTVETVTVGYATVAGTAGEADFVAARGTLRFPSGTVSRGVTVRVKGDTLGEADEETFTLELTNPTAATLADAEGTILDDDQVAVSISNAAGYERDGATIQAVFAGTLSGESARAVSAEWATASGGSAAEGKDYEAAGGSVSFAPGSTREQVTVPVLDDALLERTETFFVELADPANAALGEGRGRATILDNDQGRHPVDGTDVLYTEDADFLQGRFQGLDSSGLEHLQLAPAGCGFHNLWVAASARGTLLKIDTRTATVLGEYATSPDPVADPDPSRTAVGLDGSAWAGNRGAGSVVHVGLVEESQCTDRNGNGVIETSAGEAGARWGTIAWNAEPEGRVPAGGGIAIEARAADTEAGLGGAGYLAVRSGEPVGEHRRRAAAAAGLEGRPHLDEAAGEGEAAQPGTRNLRHRAARQHRRRLL